MKIKPCAFSGSWYPGTARVCEKKILGFIEENKTKGGDTGRLGIGGIVPHAGWVFSGRIACRVIRSLVPAEGQGVDTVVLFGAHMHSSDFGFVLASGGVDTPLGAIEVDGDLAAAFSSRAGLIPLSPSDFPDENTLELQYPFIRYFFPEARIVAAGVPPTDVAGRAGQAVVNVARQLGRTIRIIGSTDMTHYGPNFGFSPAGQGPDAVDWVIRDNDAAAIEALAALDISGILSQGLSRRNMCCPGAAAAAVSACKEKGAVKGLCLDYATSYEISRTDSFVGYCGMLYPNAG